MMEPMEEQSNIAGAGDPGDVMATSIAGEARIPEDWGNASETEDRGNAEGRKEPAAAVEEGGGMERSGWPVYGVGGATTNQGGAGWMGEHGGATRLRVPGGAEGGRSQDGADGSIGQDGAKGSEAGGRAAEWLLDGSMESLLMVARTSARSPGHLQRWRRAAGF